MFSASCYLHSPSTASVARYRRSARIDMDMLSLWQRLVATWAEFQHNVVYYATEQCRKRLEACINAEGGYSKHLLWHCLPDVPVATHHKFTTGSFQSHQWQSTTGSFQSLQRLTECNKPSVRWKSFVFHKLAWWHFQVGWASGLKIVFLLR